MKTDKQLQQDVLDELKWDPSVNASQIGVIAKHGIITLTGSTNNYLEKQSAERITKKVSGVKAVANEIDVKIEGISEKDDADIAAAALNSFKWHTSVPEKDIQLTVSNGWLTLDGQVEWNFQKEAAHEAVKNIPGVRGITNSIHVKPGVIGNDVKRKIKEALHRNAEVDANHIEVETVEGKIILQGNVHSFFEREEAEKAAWMAPGVSRVVNEIRIVV